MKEAEISATPASEKRPFYFSSFFLIAIAAAVVLIILFFDVIWDEFIFKYFWGPVEADARDKDYEGISEGYNPVNTISYGIIVAFSVYGIFHYFSRIRLKINTLFVAAILPFVVLGSVTRSLEDAMLFDIPLSYIFISPLIYIVLGLLVLALIFYFDHAERWLRCQDVCGVAAGLRKPLSEIASYEPSCFAPVKKQELKKLTMLLSIPLFLFLIFYFSLLLVDSAVLEVYLHGLVVLSLTVLFILSGVWFLKEHGFSLPFGLGFVGLYIMSFFLLYVISFVAFDRWYEGGKDVKLWVMPVIIGLALLATFLVFCLALFTEKKELLKTGPGKKSVLFDMKLTLLAFLHPLNLAVLFAHFLDAAATFVGIDHFHYDEKHVLPSFLIDVTGTAAVMFPLKLLIVFAIVYMIDVYYKKELEESGFENLQVLLKLAIIVLGLAPGMRDMLRLAMGV